MKTAILIGSFDPVTLGHLDIFQRAADIFQRVLIIVGDSPAKKYLFSAEERKALIEWNMNEPNVQITTLGNRLAADVVYEQNGFVLKGVRMAADFDYERMLQDINTTHQADVDALFFPSRPQLNCVSSSAAKEICKLHGKTEEQVPINVKAAMERRLIKQIRIGWTGPIACGKSTLAEAVIAEGKTRGLTVHNVDLDKISHDVLFCRQEPAYGLLRSRLQKALRLEEWSRKAVGHKVFNDSAARELLNNAVEPALRTRLRQELADKEGIVLINGALLVEAGWSRVCNNQVVIVTADLLTQLERLKARGHNEEEAIRRVKAQATGEQKAQLLADQFRKDNFGKWAQFTGMGDIPEKAKQILDEIITWG